MSEMSASIASFWATHGLDWTLEVTWLAAVVLLVTGVLRGRLGPGIRLLLLALVIARAVVPLDLEWKRSVDSAPSEAVPERAVAISPAPLLHAPAPQDRVRPSAERDHTARAEHTRVHRDSRETSRDAPRAVSARAPEPAGTRVDPPAQARDIPWPLLIALAWCVGVLVCFLRLAHAEWRLRRARRTTPRRATAALVEEAATIAGCRTIPRVVVLPGFPSPAVHGTFRPTLIIPAEHESMDSESLRSIFVHELFHVRRHDLLWLPIVALAEIVWWPHPLVRIAARALRATIEEARDQDTVGALARRDSEDAARSKYARVLVDLADAATGPHSTPALPGSGVATLARSLPFTRSRRELERRITMIFEFPQSKPVAKFAGTGLLCALGAFSFVDRVDVERNVGGELRPAPNQESRIEVERGAPLPDWYAEIDACLDERHESIEVEPMPPLEAIERVAQAIGCPIRVPEEARSELEDARRIRLSLHEVTGREILDLLARLFRETSWTVAEGSIHFGEDYALPYSADRRFYRVEPLIEALEQTGEKDASEELLSVVQNHALGDSITFDREGTSLSEWRGLLTVRVSERDHRSILDFLDRMLERRLVPTPSNEPWRDRIAEALRTPLRCELDSTASAYEAIRRIGDAAGVMIDSNVVGELEELNVEDWRRLTQEEFVPLDVLTEIASLADLHVDITSGALLLTDQPTTSIHFYPLDELADSLDAEHDDLADEVQDFLQFDVAPESWDYDPRLFIHRIGDLLLVNQYPPVHPEIALLLDQLQRAASGE